MHSKINAIIIADRFSEAFLPYTFEIHQSMLEMRKKSLLESQLEKLRAVGIFDISVVYGYRGELLKKIAIGLNAQAIYNPNYFDLKLTGALYAVRNKLSSALIVDGNCSMDGNLEIPTEEKSWTTPDFSMVYLTGRDSELISDLIFKAFKNHVVIKDWAKLFEGSRVHLPVSNISAISLLKSRDDLAVVDPSFVTEPKTMIMRRLCNIFQASPYEFKDFCCDNKGLSNQSCKFSVRGISYFLRYPGRLTNEIVNRRQEYETYMAFKEHNLDFCDDVIFFDYTDGLKITKLIADFYYPDSSREEHNMRCIKLIRKLHDSNIRTAYNFELADCLTRSEKYINCDPEQYLPDYAKTRQSFFSVYENALSEGKQVLCHTDPSRYNFLLTDRHDYLIDFEYAGMGSPMVDLSSFAIYNGYNREQEIKMLEIYFGRSPYNSEVMLLDRYIGLSGFAYAVWYLVRLRTSCNFLQPMLKSYQYAVERLKPVKNVNS